MHARSPSDWYHMNILVYHVHLTYSFSQRALISLNAKERWVHSGCLNRETGGLKPAPDGYVLTDFDISCNLEIFLITELTDCNVSGTEFAFCLRCKLPIFQRSDAEESQKNGKFGYIHSTCTNLKRKFELVVDLVEEE